MRIVFSSLIALGISITGAFAGGGTVTSTEAGPQTLTSQTTDQMLDTMGIVESGAQQDAPATIPALIVHLSPPPAPPAPIAAEVTPTPVSTEPVIQYASPPPAPQEEKAEAEPQQDTSKATKVASLTPRESVQRCATCHGYDGIAKIPTAPNIAGSSRQYLETQLKAFRSGKRENEVMSVIAEDLSNAEIKMAAKWYAGLKITVEGSE